jgi:SsrA-binding protein
MKPIPDSTVTVNKRAFHDYEVLESFEAGLKLVGTEVKAIRQGSVNLRGSYVIARSVPTGAKPKRGVAPARTILQVINMQVNAYGPAGPGQHDPHRPRELLLHAKERDRIAGALTEKGQTAVPLDVHFAHGLIKLRVAVVRGKKLHDKRRTLKEREVKRTIQRAMKR